MCQRKERTRFSTPDFAGLLEVIDTSTASATAALAGKCAAFIDCERQTIASG